MANAAVIAITPEHDPADGDRPDPVAESILAVQDLFAGPLAEVRFPDFDRDILAESIAAVRAADAEVAALEESLRAARAVVNDAQDTLLQKAQRGVAYARIFADGQDELLAAIDAITLPAKRGARVVQSTPAKRAEPRRRKKSAPEGDSLFVGTDSTPPQPAPVTGGKMGEKGADKAADKAAAHIEEDEPADDLNDPLKDETGDEADDARAAE